MNAITCAQCRAALPEYLSGDLPAAERRAVADHLSGCAECRAELVRWQALAGAVRRRVKSATPPPPRWARLRAALPPSRTTRGATPMPPDETNAWPTPPPRRSQPEKRRVRAVLAGLAVAATLIAAFAALFLSNHGGRDIRDPGVQRPAGRHPKLPVGQSLSGPAPSVPRRG